MLGELGKDDDGIFGNNWAIPPRVVKHWRSKGKSWKWISEKNTEFKKDYMRRMQNNRLRDEKLDISICKSKLPEVDELLNLYQKYSMPAIAKKYGVSTQRVQQVLSTHPDYQPYLYKKVRDKKIVQLFKNGKSTKAISNQMGLKRSLVLSVLHKHNIKINKKRKSIGCKNCYVDEYSRGMCRNCYAIWLRRGKPNLAIVKDPAKPWGKKYG